MKYFKVNKPLYHLMLKKMPLVKPVTFSLEYVLRISFYISLSAMAQKLCQTQSKTHVEPLKTESR